MKKSTPRLLLALKITILLLLAICCALLLTSCRLPTLPTVTPTPTFVAPSLTAPALTAVWTPTATATPQIAGEEKQP